LYWWFNGLIKTYQVNDFFSNGYLDNDIEQKINSEKIGQNDVVSIGLFGFDVVLPEDNLENKEDGNENSVAGILRVKNNNWSMFLTGDMEIEAEQKLVWRQILNSPVTVLKVSHHGSKTAISQELLDVLKPKIAVISVEKNNRFGHPTEEVLKRLENSRAEIKRTDEVFFKRFFYRG
jgi:competence protein ComEC